jgi:large repetitive protein
VTATFNAATGVWTASGSIADVNAALAAVTFNPALNFNGSFSIATSISDGLAAITGTKSFTGVAVNDAPSGADKSLTLGEDTSYTFTVADFGFTDTADAGQTLVAVKIATLPVASTGVLLFNNAAMAAGTSVTVAEIAAGRLTFVPADDSTAPASFTFQVQDSGGTANGGINLDPTANTASFTIVAGTDVVDNKVNGNAANTTFDVNFGTATNLNVSILDAGGTDVLNEQGLLTYGSFRFERFSNNLELTATSGTKTLHVALLDQYVGANAIESVTFQNGGQVGTSAGGFTLGTAAYNLAQTGTGTAGSDVLAGSSQDDVLSGGGGKDLVFGSGGNDTLTGGTGNDLLMGGLGSDTFVFAESGTANADTILDFQAGVDSLQLAASAFASAEANPDGTLKANNFAAQASATTANQHILFDPATGSLFYDADGSGAGAKVLVAQFELAGLTGTLSAADFKIV